MDKQIFLPCRKCKKERRVYLYQTKKPTFTNICISCNQKAKRGNKNSNWKGGKYLNAQGYVLILLQPSDFFYKMASTRGYVLEHRLVMAKHLGRNLHSWEIVHHKGDIAKDDNRIEVLQLVSDDKHKQISVLERRIKYLEKQNLELKTQLSVLNIKMGDKKED